MEEAEHDTLLKSFEGCDEEVDNMELSSDEEDDEGDTYPEWLEVQITHTSR